MPLFGLLLFVSLLWSVLAAFLARWFVPRFVTAWALGFLPVAVLATLWSVDLALEVGRHGPQSWGSEGNGPASVGAALGVGLTWAGLALVGALAGASVAHGVRWGVARARCR